MFSPELIEAYDKALAELHVRTMSDVQRATALTWGGRALAAYHFFDTTGDLHWLIEASDYAHESMEHAALHPDPYVLDLVRPALLAAADRAQRHPVFAQFATTGCYSCAA